MLRKERKKVYVEDFHISDCFWAIIKLKSHQWKISVNNALRKKTDNQIRILTIFFFFEK